jgi:hypothetical protein
VNVSAVNPMTSIKRTSLIVYEPDIFNCSQQSLTARPTSDERLEQRCRRNLGLRGHR